MRRLTRHIVILFRLPLILGIAIFNVLIAKPVVLRGTERPSFKDIRAVYTAEFGVRHPTGFAFLPKSQGFLLWGGQSNQAEVQLISDYEDSAGALILPIMAEDPPTAAFDNRSNSLFMWKNEVAELIKIGIDQNGLPGSSSKNVIRYNTRAFDIQRLQGIAFDPTSGRLFILDSKGPRIVSVVPSPTKGFDGDAASHDGRINRLNIRGFENTQFRGIAFNPQNDHLYVAAPSEQKVYEFTQKGEVVSILDLGSLQLTNIQAMTFVPSADQTDDPATMNLFVLDGGVRNMPEEKQRGGRILELSLQPQFLPSGTSLLPSTLVHTFDTSNATWNPSSPDPSGVDYWPLVGRLLISDSEVDEMSNYFTGKNVYATTSLGTLTNTCSTTNLSRTGFSNEPSGVAINPNNNHIYFSDDDKHSIFEVSLGLDNTYCTSDDMVTSVNVGALYNILDPEDVAYGNNTIFIAGGTDAEVYMFSLGPNRVLGGGDDGPITHFDTAILGFQDLEGIGYNADQDTLFIVSASSGDRYLGETTSTGTLLRAYDLSFMGSASNLRSDVAYGPSSQNLALKNIYVVSRGVDNDNDPNENDGKVWEISLIPPPTPTPSKTATATLTSTPTSNNPLFASFTNSGSVGGVSFSDEDILRFNGVTWSLFFDGSDVGVGSPDLFAFSFLDSDSVLMSFSSGVTLNGISATSQDILRFDATSLGSVTAGTFSMYLDGSDVGLDTSSEAIDSISLLSDGRVLISTTGNPSVLGVAGTDEDILAFTPTTLGDVTSGTWSVYFDGSDVGLADTSNEDIDALDIDSNGTIYLSTLGDFSVTGVFGFDEDVFVCVPTSLGSVTACNYLPMIYFDGSTWGLSSNDMDAFNFLSLDPVPTSMPTDTPTSAPTPTSTFPSTPTFTVTATPTPTWITTLGPSPTPTDTPTPTITNMPDPTFTSTATFMPSPTSAVSDLIFTDSFESGNFSAWTASVTNSGNLNVSPSAALVGNYALQAIFNNTTSMYVRDDSLNAELRYRARFYFHPNSIAMATGDYAYTLQGHDTSNTIILLIQFNRSSIGYQLRARAYDSVLANWVSTPYATISNAVHYVEVDWGNDGHLIFWVDGVQQGSLIGINNSNYTIDSVRLGAPYIRATAISGSYYIDAFESRRETYIGP